MNQGQTISNGFLRSIYNDNLETHYGQDDFVNPEAFENSEFKGKAFVILNGGFVQAIVFSEYPGYSESDALDEAVDSGKMGDPLTVEELEDYETGDYTDIGNEHSPDSKGWPEYDERIVWLGNASEPYDGEGWDMWIVSASIFAEDMALMTPDRVMARLQERLDTAEREYQKTDVYDASWSLVYGRRQDLRDAVTLARLTIAR